MIKTSTPNDIIRYVYNETSLDENYFIEQSLIEDDSLQRIYQDLISLQAKLDKAILNPSDAVIKKILIYSKSFNNVGL